MANNNTNFDMTSVLANAFAQFMAAQATGNPNFFQNAQPSAPVEEEAKGFNPYALYAKAYGKNELNEFVVEPDDISEFVDKRTGMSKLRICIRKRNNANMAKNPEKAKDSKEFAVVFAFGKKPNAKKAIKVKFPSLYLSKNAEAGIAKDKDGNVVTTKNGEVVHHNVYNASVCEFCK